MTPYEMTPYEVRGLAVGALLAAVFFGPMLYRMARPPPSEDLKAIDRFLKNRDETLVDVRKLWIGGPWRRGYRTYRQMGRPYRVVARSADGSRWIHFLAANVPGDAAVAMLNQRLNGMWSPVIQ